MMFNIPFVMLDSTGHSEQAREEWIAGAERTLREDGFGADSRRVAESAWEYLQQKSPVAGCSYDELEERYRGEGLL